MVSSRNLLTGAQLVGINERFRRQWAKFGRAGVSPKAAMALLQRGVDQTVIALWLGHESAETTQIYLHADMRLKEQALAHATSSGLAPGRYEPEDSLLAFLESL